MKRDIPSPSTTRWSNDPATVVTQRGRTSPSTTHGFWRIVPRATIPASPGVLIGGRRLALPGRERELLERSCEVAQAEVLRVLDVRDEEAPRGRRGDAEV